MATLIRFNNAEGGTDGVAVTTGNSGGASGDAFNSVVGTGLTFSNLVVGAGSLSYRTANASVYALWNGLGGVTNWTLKARVYFANVTQTQGVVYARESNGDYTSLEYSGSSRFWRIRGTGGTVSGTVQLNAATWYDIELSCANSTTNTARIYNTSGVLLDTVTFGNTVTVALDEAWFGSFVATGIYPSYFDSFGVYNDKVDTLTANGLTSNSSVGNPALTTSGGTSLTANPIQSSSIVGTPAITQSHILTPSDIVANSYVGRPALNGAGDNDPYNVYGLDWSGENILMANSDFIRAYRNRYTEVDSFGRGRVSLPITQFDYQNQYNRGDLIWETKTTLSGSATHLPNEASVRMSTGGTAGTAGVIRQTRSYWRYHPGKSQYILITGDFGTPVQNVIKRLGYFDGSNGVFFEQNFTGVCVGVRTSTSGSPVDNVVYQSDWNVDKMDGSGPSGISVDWTKAQIFYLDLEWLGVGRVRYGLNISGNSYIVHQQDHANLLDLVYMSTANLPVRYEIFNAGVAGSTATMDQICSSVMTETGPDDESAYTHTASNGITAIGVTTRRAVLSIRPKATFNGLVNRGKITIDNFEVYAATNSAYYELVYGGTIGGSPSWTSAGTNSIVEYDVAGTTVTGGEIVVSGYITSTASLRTSIEKFINDKYPLTLDISGANPVNLSLVFTSFTGTSNISAAFNFKEVY